MGRREAGEGVLGSQAGSLSPFLSLSAAFGGFSLPVFLCPFHSASLTVFHRILHCKFTTPSQDTPMSYSGKVGMGLSERRTVLAAGVII